MIPQRKFKVGDKIQLKDKNRFFHYYIDEYYDKYFTVSKIDANFYYLKELYTESKGDDGWHISTTEKSFKLYYGRTQKLKRLLNDTSNI